MDKREVDLVEAAARLRVPWHTAHRLVLTGRLEGERRNGRWRVVVASILKYELQMKGSRGDVGPSTKAMSATNDPTYRSIRPPVSRR